MEAENGDQRRMDWLTKHAHRRPPSYGYHGASFEIYVTIPDDDPKASLRRAIEVEMLKEGF